MGVQAERGYEKESVCSQGERPWGFAVAWRVSIRVCDGQQAAGEGGQCDEEQ